MLTRLLTSTWYPERLQWISAVVFVPTLVLLLFGSPDRLNPAHLVVWVVWWPLLCALFLVAGRVWCSLCPFPPLGRLAQRAKGLQLPVPDFLKRHGAWLIAIAFFLLSWMEETTDAVESPRRTAVVLLTILSGAVISGLLFRGRAWCRYVCPLGGMSLVYARTSLLKIRASEAACAECATKDCVVPDALYQGCPMHLTPFAIDTVSSCSFCGSCVRRCTNQSLRVSLEAPSLDLSGRSPATPAVVWLCVLLAGHLSFLSLVRSPRLPVADWLRPSANPALLKTVLMAGSMAVFYFLFVGGVRLAAGFTAPPARMRMLQLFALPMIPLLLFGHLGHVSAPIWTSGGPLLALVASVTGLTWLRVDSPSLAAWTGYFNPLCIVLGLAWTLWVSRWVLSSEPDLPVRRVGWSFALLYGTWACWNLFTTWPVAATGAGTATARSAVHGPEDGWAVLWPFVGVNAAFLALAVVVRRSEQRSASDGRQVEFGASRSWVVRDTSGASQAEILEWLLDQAVEARWRIPAVVRLADATAEVVAFVQRNLPGGSVVTVNATLRRNKGIVTIFHDGRPLALPEHRLVTSLQDADDAALNGLELRLAESQVEQLSYQARLSDGRCCFTLRQTCQGVDPG